MGGDFNTIFGSKSNQTTVCPHSGVNDLQGRAAVDSGALNSRGCLCTIHRHNLELYKHFAIVAFRVLFSFWNFSISFPQCYPQPLLLLLLHAYIM